MKPTALIHTALALVLAFAITLPARAAHPGPPAHDDDIVDVAVKAGAFKTLVAAVKAAGLVETLKGDGPFTVFAPTDEAFAQLPAGTVESLLKPENRDQLVAILTYHVVPGKIRSTDLLSTTSAKTVNGQSAPIGLRVGDANVVQADIEASNGIIHVIDAVLLPPQKTRMETSSVNMARDQIRQAIDRGVPLYNQGDAEACTAIYAKTARMLLEADLPATVQRPLRRALERMGHSHNHSDRAWIMREGLDEAYASLSARRMSTAASHH